MSRAGAAAVAAALLLAPAAGAQTPAPAQTPAANAADVASPEAVITALYATVQRAPGARFDWNRIRPLFLPTARLIPNTEQTGGRVRVLTLEEFIAWIDGVTVVGGPQDRGFAEEQISARVERFGDVAHVFSTYQKRFHGDSRILGRGINSVQLVFHDGRWWISQLAWDEESGAGPLPAKYLPGG